MTVLGIWNHGFGNYEAPTVPPALDMLVGAHFRQFRCRETARCARNTRLSCARGTGYERTLCQTDITQHCSQCNFTAACLPIDVVKPDFAVFPAAHGQELLPRTDPRWQRNIHHAP